LQNYKKAVLLGQLDFFPETYADKLQNWAAVLSNGLSF
jgi:hypothetical protein